jgi:hypothetical protein
VCRSNYKHTQTYGIRTSVTNTTSYHIMSTIGGNNNSGSLPLFSDNAAAYLGQISSRAPSPELLASLAGVVALSIRDETNTNTNSRQVAALYLQAAAQQLSAGSLSAVSAVAAGSNNTNSKADVESEMKSAQQLYEITEVCTRTVSIQCRTKENAVLVV